MLWSLVCWDMLHCTLCKSSHWMADGIDIVLGYLSWISCSKTNSEYPSYVSSLCFYWRSSSGDFWACYLFWRHAGTYLCRRFHSVYDIKRSEISIIVQGMTLGLLLFPKFFKLIYQISVRLKFLDNYRERANHHVKKSFLFYVSLTFMLTVVVPSWMQFVQDFQTYPLLWVLDFVFSEPLKRLSLCSYWIALIYASVMRFYEISKKSKIERILLRKYYHLMAVLMFVPALIFQVS